MSIYIRRMNPIRFYNQDKLPDYTTYFPNNDNIRLQENVIPGIIHTRFYKDHIVNKEIRLQFGFLSTSEDLEVYKYDETTQSYNLEATVNPTDITPDGWIAETVNKYVYTPTSKGVYYFKFASSNVYSDKIIVHSLEKFRKRLIEIQYYNSENDYGMVFWDNSTQQYVGLGYFTGQLNEMTGQENEMSVFNSDRGLMSKLRSTPVNVSNLILCDLHYSYIKTINHIFSCDNITVNGITFQSEDAPDIERKEKSDLVDITIKLSQTEDFYIYT